MLRKEYKNLQDELDNSLSHNETLTLDLTISNTVNDQYKEEIQILFDKIENLKSDNLLNKIPLTLTVLLPKN